MSVNKNISIKLFILFSLFATVFAKDLLIIAPYYGNISNTYTNSKYGLNMEDTQMMDGIYAQFVSPENGQTNIFLYQAPNVNYSKVTGLHALSDWYFGQGDKWVIGLGYDNIIINMDAGNHIAGLDLFKLDNDVKEVYLRLGKYFSAGEYYGVTTRFLPYLGYGTETVAGSIVLNPSGPAPLMTIPVYSQQNYPLAGLNGHFEFHHFITIDAKHMVMFQTAKNIRTTTIEANLYFTKNLGLTYQYKNMEQTNGSDIYSIAGIVLVL